MKTKIISSIMIISFLCSGCDLLNENDNISKIDNEGVNTSPPILLCSTKEVALELGGTSKIYPKDVASDADGDKLKFSVPEESTFENDFAIITITEDYIECELKEEVNDNISDTFKVNVTDGEFRTELNIKITGESEEKELTGDNGIPFAKGNPVEFILEDNEMFINVEDLATSSGEVLIDSINGSNEYTGTYGVANVFNSYKIKYTSNNSATGTETFNVIVTNGTNNIPVNVEITIN